MRHAKAQDGSRIVVRGLSLTLADDRRQNRDALLALANEATHRAPRLKARDARRGRALVRDQRDIMPAECLLADYVKSI
jgi:hypothetical protein